MDAIRRQLSNPLYAALAGLVVGILIGLVVFGWWLWPVQWTDASPADLVFQEQANYLRMAVQAFAGTGNTVEAQARYLALGENREKVLQEIVIDPQGVPIEQIQQFGTVVLTGALPAPGTAAPEATAPAGEVPAEGGGVRTLIPWICGIGLVIAAALAAVYFLRNRIDLTNRMPRPVRKEVTQQPLATSQPEFEPEPVAVGSREAVKQPIAKTMATYRDGEDYFDELFKLDMPNGAYIGECGSSIVERIGVGDHRKVSAFDVWLYDKNDVQTVTKILMSAHAYEDEEIRQRLEPRGELVLAEPGAKIELETQTLVMVARVVDMEYGASHLPDNSYFTRFVVELTVWPKA